MATHTHAESLCRDSVCSREAGLDDKQLRKSSRVRARKAALRASTAERRRPRQATRPHRPSYVELRAPPVLDLFGDPAHIDSTLEYTNMVRAALSSPNTRVFMDLSAVTEFSSDAILLIRAVMDRETRSRHTSIGGNLRVHPMLRLS